MSLFVFAIFILLLNITVFKLSKGISGNILLSSVIVFLLVPFVFRFSSQMRVFFILEDYFVILGGDVIYREKGLE